LKKWTAALHKQYNIWSLSSAASRSSGQQSSTSDHCLAWNANVDMNFQRNTSDDEPSDDEEEQQSSGAYSQRSASSLGTRSRSATGDSTTLRAPLGQAPPRFPMPPTGQPLSLMTQVSISPIERDATRSYGQRRIVFFTSQHRISNDHSNKHLLNQ